MTTLDERPEAAVTLGADADRVEARKRLEARRGFMSDAVAYVVINAFLIGIWALTGAGYFWPA